MSKNLLIIGYCHLADGFLYASKALKNNGATIFFFPYYSYIMDNVLEKDEILIKYIEEKKIDICLWWNNSIKYESIEQIIDKTYLGQNSIKHILFNWDPALYEYKKYNADCWKERIDEKFKIYPLMDYVYTCFKKELLVFKEIDSIFPIYYNPPGFDSNISKYEYDENYICDISIVCTNLYDCDAEFPQDSTNISRYEIVNKLYENRDIIKFHFYGPERFKDIYPDCYKGFIKYDDCNKVFSNSKINLSIHPLVYELDCKNCFDANVGVDVYEDAEYFSERVPQILGSKGLLMSNSNFSYFLKKEIDYIYIDKSEDWFEKIMIIISNSEKYENIRKSGYLKAIERYQWANWAKNITNNL